jgi:hypothetical protein
MIITREGKSLKRIEFHRDLHEEQRHVLYSVMSTLQSLGITPVCIPTNCFQIGLETEPIPSSPVGISTSSPMYPILSTGLMTAAVPTGKLDRKLPEVLDETLYYRLQKVPQEIQTGKLPSLPSL